MLGLRRGAHSPKSTELFSEKDIPPEMRHLPRHLVKHQLRDASGSIGLRSPTTAPTPAPSMRKARSGAPSAAASAGTPPSNTPGTSKSERRRQQAATPKSVAGSPGSKPAKPELAPSPAERPVASRSADAAPAASAAHFATPPSRARRLSATELREHANVWHAQAAETLADKSGTLAARLGTKLRDLLHERNQTPAELFADWDMDGSGSISRAEFTLAVRRMRLVGDPSVPEAMFRMRSLSKEDAAMVDALFDSLDLDGGGDLDLDEVAQGLDELLELAATAASEEAVTREIAESMTARAKMYEAAAAAAEAAEALAVEMKQLIDNPSIELRAGKQLIKYTKGPTSAQLSEYTMPPPPNTPTLPAHPLLHPLPVPALHPIWRPQTWHRPRVEQAHRSRTLTPHRPCPCVCWQAAQDMGRQRRRGGGHGGVRRRPACVRHRRRRRRADAAGPQLRR